MTNVIKGEDEFVRAENTGLYTLDQYGLNERNSTIILLYFTIYMPSYATYLLSSFFENNSSFHIGQLPTIANISKVTKNLSNDELQVNLRTIVLRQFTIQQYGLKQQYDKEQLKFNHIQDFVESNDLDYDIISQKYKDLQDIMQNVNTLGRRADSLKRQIYHLQLTLCN